MSVLLVEDERVNRKILSIILSRLVTDVREAANGVEALAACEARVPDVIITDLSMPELDGLELIAELGRRGWERPTIVLTAHNDGGLAEVVARRHRLLFKPLRVNALADALEQIATELGLYRLSERNGVEPPGP